MTVRLRSLSASIQLQADKQVGKQPRQGWRRRSQPSAPLLPCQQALYLMSRMAVVLPTPEPW